MVKRAIYEAPHYAVVSSLPDRFRYFSQHPKEYLMKLKYHMSLAEYLTQIINPTSSTKTLIQVKYLRQFTEDLMQLKCMLRGLPLA